MAPPKTRKQKSQSDWNEEIEQQELEEQSEPRAALNTDTGDPTGEHQANDDSSQDEAEQTDETRQGNVSNTSVASSVGEEDLNGEREVREALAEYRIRLTAWTSEAKTVGGQVKDLEAKRNEAEDALKTFSAALHELNKAPDNDKAKLTLVSNYFTNELNRMYRDHKVVKQIHSAELLTRRMNRKQSTHEQKRRANATHQATGAEGTVGPRPNSNGMNVGFIDTTQPPPIGPLPPFYPGVHSGPQLTPDHWGRRPTRSRSSQNSEGASSLDSQEGGRGRDAAREAARKEFDKMRTTFYEEREKIQAAIAFVRRRYYHTFDDLRLEAESLDKLEKDLSTLLEKTKAKAKPFGFNTRTLMTHYGQLFREVTSAREHLSWRQERELTRTRGMMDPVSHIASFTENERGSRSTPPPAVADAEDDSVDTTPMAVADPEDLEQVSFNPDDHPIQVLRAQKSSVRINWQHCYGGQNDRVYYDPAHFRERMDDKIQVPVFDGEPSSDFRKFQSMFEAAVNRRRGVRWKDKMIHLKAKLSGKALTMVSLFNEDKTGYFGALFMLQREYGGFDSELVNLHHKLSNLEKISLKDVGSLTSVRDLLRKIMLMSSATEGRAKANFEIAAFSNVKAAMTRPTAIHWRDFLNRERYTTPTIEAYEDWVGFWVKEERDKAQEALTSGAGGGAAMPALATMESEEESDSTEEDNSDEEEDIEVFITTDELKSYSKCPHCQKSDHSLTNCLSFKQLSPSKRRMSAYRYKACFKCLQGAHLHRDCPSGGKCQHCQGPHHTLVHTMRQPRGRGADGGRRERANRGPPLSQKQWAKLRKLIDKMPEEEAEPTLCTEAAEVSLATTATGRLALFGVVPVRIRRHEQEEGRIYNMVLDSCSRRTICTDDLVEQMGLPYENIEHRLRTLTGTATLQAKKVEFFVESLDGRTNFKVQAATGDLPKTIKPTYPDQIQRHFPELTGISLPDPGARDRVDILLGIDYHWYHRSTVVKDLGPTKPLIRATPFGLSCTYTANEQDAVGSQDLALLGEHEALLQTDAAAGGCRLEQLLEKTWSTDVLGIVPRTTVFEKPWSKAEQRAADMVESSLKRRADGSYEAGVPWKNGQPNLEYNGDQARHLTQKMEAKMKPTVRTECDKINQELMDATFIRPLTEAETAKRDGYYNTWFPVIREDKVTTRVRIVINCAQKFGHIIKKSLNDEILQGPKLHNDLLAVLLRFRRGKIALGGDIRKMYFMFHLPEEDQKYHRFWWRGQAYQFTRWPFGNTAAPFVALFIVRHHIQTQAPLALQQKLLPALYVDDILLSVEEEDEAIKLRQDISNLMAEGGMTVCKWFSNNSRVTETIPAGQRAHQCIIGEDPESLTLGFKYHPEDDTLTVREFQPEVGEITRRTITADQCKLYDPIGLTDACTLKGKRTAQKLAVLQPILGLNWDEKLRQSKEPLVAQVVKDWEEHCDDLQDVHTIRVPRCFKPRDGEHELHLFCDGSKVAIASCAYWRTVTSDDVEVNLVCSKRRLNPVEDRSIPQIELNSATMGARLGNYLQEILAPGKVYFWNDNRCCLYWIKRSRRPGGQRRDVYVGHRATEITWLTNPADWNHVPTDQNPADLPTRGKSVAEIKEDTEQLWMKGPPFLKLSSDKWPQDGIEITEDDVAALDTRTKKRPKREILEAELMLVDEANIPDTVTLPENGLPIPNADCHPARWTDDQEGAGEAALDRARGVSQTINVKRFSIWSRLLNTWTKVKQWQLGEPREKARVEAFRDLVVMTQQEGFAEALRHKRKHGRFPTGHTLEAINASYDQNQCLRVSGRGDRQTFAPIETRRPLILPSDHYITSLLLHQYHREGDCRDSRAKTGAKVALIWHIEGLNNRLKTLWKTCARCVRIRGRPQHQLMGQRPDLSLQVFRPFSYIAMDYGGPFPAKQGRAQIRAYLLVIVCMQSRAVYLTITTKLDADQLMLGLTQLKADVGGAEKVHTDNGSAFIRAAKVTKSNPHRRALRQELANIDWEDLQARGEKIGIREWNFSPPYYPEQNGTAEAMVKLAKSQFIHLVQEKALPLELLRGLVKEAQHSVNSRPVATEEVEGAIVTITPNHLLFGRAGSALLDPGEYHELHLVRQYQEMERIHTMFSKAWANRVLQSLHSREKWRQQRQNLAAGQVVVAAMPDKKRHQWPVGKVISVVKNREGIVHEAEIEIGESQRRQRVRKPLCHLVPLDLFCE